MSETDMEKLIAGLDFVKETENVVQIMLIYEVK